jgi:hypothetical protein
MTIVDTLISCCFSLVFIILKQIETLPGLHFCGAVTQRAQLGTSIYAYSRASVYSTGDGIS